MQTVIEFPTHKKQGLYDITQEVRQALKKSAIMQGLVVLTLIEDKEI